MEAVRYLLGSVIKLALSLFAVAFVLWLIGFLYPQFAFSNLISKGVFSHDWLPAPKNYGSLFGGRTADGVSGKVYVPGNPYNGNSGNAGYQSQNGVDFTIYTDSGTKIVRANGTTGTINSQSFAGSSSYSERVLYVRNISIYEGGNISYGETFVGEARDIMFRNGIFPIQIIDRQGRILATTQGINLGTWATPGWVRFQATIPVRLPYGADCALIFLSANQSIKVGMAVRCN